MSYKCPVLWLLFALSNALSSDILKLRSLDIDPQRLTVYPYKQQNRLKRVKMSHLSGFLRARVYVYVACVILFKEKRLFWVSFEAFLWYHSRSGKSVLWLLLFTRVKPMPSECQVNAQKKEALNLPYAK